MESLEDVLRHRLGLGIGMVPGAHMTHCVADVDAHTRKVETLEAELQRTTIALYKKSKADQEQRAVSHLIDGTVVGLRAQVSALTETNTELERKNIELLHGAEKAMLSTHQSGVYRSTDLVFPVFLVAHMRTLLQACKLYSTDVWKKVAQDREPALAAHIAQLIDLRLDVSLLAGSAVTVRKAILVSSFARELFRFFESDSYSADGTVLPSTDRRERRVRAADEWRAVMDMSCEELQAARPAFNQWLAALQSRMSQWLVQDVALDTLINDQLLEAARQAWALHRLTRAFPQAPELVHMQHGDAWDAQYCKSIFNKDENGDEFAPGPEGARVVCLVFPGYLLDDSIEKCDVFCAV